MDLLQKEGYFKNFYFEFKLTNKGFEEVVRNLVLASYIVRTLKDA